MSYCPDRHLRYNAHYAKVTQGSKGQDVNTTTVAIVKDIRQYRFDQVKIENRKIRSNGAGYFSRNGDAK